MKTKSQTCFLLFLVFCSAAGTIQGGVAEELMGKLPSDTFLAAAWSGTEVQEAAFEQSILGQVWKDPQVQTFYQALLDAVNNPKTAQIDPNDLVKIRCVQRLLPLCLQKPFALGVSGGSADPGTLSLFFVLQAGSDKPKFETALAETFQRLELTPHLSTKDGLAIWTLSSDSSGKNFYWTWLDTVFLAAIHDVQGRWVKSFGEGDSLSSQRPLSGLSAREDLLALYWDISAFLSRVRSWIPAGEDPAVSKNIENVLSHTGLDRVQRFVLRVGFEGRAVVSESLLEMPGGSGGLLSKLGTVRPDVFGAADGRALKAFAFSLLWGPMYDECLNLLQSAMSEAEYKDFSQFVSSAEERLGFSIRQDILENLSGPVLGYVMPAYTVAEVPQGGVVLLADVVSSEPFQKALGLLGDFAQKEAPEQFQIHYQALSEDRQICVWVNPVLALAQVMPSWVLSDSKLILASHPVLVKEAAIRLKETAGEGGLCRNEKFSSVQRSYPAAAVSLSYTDTGAHIRQMLLEVQSLWPMLTMAAAQKGFQLPILLPNLDAHLSQFPPTVSYLVQSPRGLESRYIGTGLEVNAAAVGGAAAAAAVLMPALNKARQVAQRVESATNLKTIGNAAFLYANRHDGQFPPDLQTLVQVTDLSPKVLRSPYPRPDSMTGPDYCYIPGQGLSSSGRNVLVYENPQFARRHLNILYVDGHIEMVELGAIQKEVVRTYENLNRPIPPEEAVRLGLGPAPQTSPAEK